jgi:twinkle protein
MLPWKKTHDKLGFLPGEVTLWGGMSGHGKSAILGQACTEFARTGKRIVIASMEMKPMITLARMCRQEYGRVPSVDEIRQFHVWSDKKLWLYDQQGAVKSERMLAVLRYSVEVLKADHFVIDSLMKCGMAEDDYTAQKHFVDQLCATAMDENMHVHLVAHSRKSRDEFTPPGKMDVKGTGSITDQVSNVITVWRNKKKEADAANGIYAGSEPDCLLICDKQRNGEWEGKIGLFFNQDRMRFEESAGGTF